MENLILVPGEIVGIDIKTIPKITAKSLKKLFKLQVENKDGVEFLPCLYGGNTKNGSHKLLVAIAQPVPDGGTAFIPTEMVVKVKPCDAEAVIGPYFGIIHGTVDSLPPVIPIPGFPNIGVKIRTQPENKFKFTANIEKNLDAVAKHSKPFPKTRALIYGPPSSGKTSLADKLASETGYPWISVSPKWLTIGGQAAMSSLAFIVALSEQRKFAILFDDIDELLGIIAGGFDEDDEEGGSGGPLGLSAYYFVLETMKNHPMPLIFTAVGKFPVDHIVSQCNVFFSLHFAAEDLKQIWREVCPTAKELADEIAEENLPLAMMYAVVKQAEMIAKLSKRKIPNKEDVKTALTCFGKRDDPKKPGFSRE